MSNKNFCSNTAFHPTVSMDFESSDWCLTITKVLEQSTGALPALEINYSQYKI